MKKSILNWLKAMYLHKIQAMTRYADDLYGVAEPAHEAVENQKTIYMHKLYVSKLYAKNLCGAWERKYIAHKR